MIPAVPGGIPAYVGGIPADRREIPASAGESPAEAKRFPPLGARGRGVENFFQNFHEGNAPKINSTRPASQAAKKTG
jgi:hypothetical protein